METQCWASFASNCELAQVRLEGCTQNNAGKHGVHKTFEVLDHLLEEIETQECSGDVKYRDQGRK
jgi:hypothetical protein